MNVHPTAIIYKYGAQSGGTVHLVNYPRFPRSPDELLSIAKEMAQGLMDACFQRTAMVQADDYTFWLHREGTDE